MLRRLHDLWKVGRSQNPPTRPRVVLAVGDSISDTKAYITDASFDCALPDFSFEAGYRLLGQPGTFETVRTAKSGATARWGQEVVSDDTWWREVRPEVATVAFGTNELWSGDDSLDSYARNLRGIVDRLAERGVLPVLVTPPPGLFRPAGPREVCGRRIEPAERAYEVADFADVVRQVAAERSLPVVDVYRRFIGFDRPQAVPTVWRALGICRDPSDERTCDRSLWWRTLLGDVAHPCARRCPPGVDIRGMDLRTDAILRMYRYLERAAMERCRGARPPPAPDGYRWDPADPLASLRSGPDRSYCPDPVLE